MLTGSNFSHVHCAIPCYQPCGPETTSQPQADQTTVCQGLCKFTGEPVFAWCGPQPNSRLLLNYGIVDEQNPNDKMTITATIPNNDPLFPQKRYLLQQHNMSSQQSFQLQRHHVSHAQCL